MKKVVYLKQEFEVPEWAKWIAADSDGEVYAYAVKPYRSSGGYTRLSADHLIEHVGTVGISPLLQEIK